MTLHAFFSKDEMDRREGFHALAQEDCPTDSAIAAAFGSLDTRYRRGFEIGVDLDGRLHQYTRIGANPRPAEGEDFLVSFPDAEPWGLQCVVDEYGGVDQDVARDHSLPQTAQDIYDLVPNFTPPRQMRIQTRGRSGVSSPDRSGIMASDDPRLTTFIRELFDRPPRPVQTIAPTKRTDLADLGPDPATRRRRSGQGPQDTWWKPQ